ncbi:glycosyltransferase [Arcticibacter sp. MXS-1]|uniref:glycosyltransferase n=1 Tax=Arcticibacter sp. MXS-1 TaxID=3341726 RepID=UPI0035A8EC92
MNVVLFTHPPFLGSQSMPRFAGMLLEGMRSRGHQVDVWTPEAAFFNLAPIPAAKKWFGYIDQYVVFPSRVKRLIEKMPADTLFVFSDQALGPWIPLVKARPHVVHCHDFLAQRSALGEIPENPVRFSGRKYQKYIRKGYRSAKNFISVSEKTREDLHRFLSHTPVVSEVVYNGLNKRFQIKDPASARSILGKRIGVDLSQGYLLHVGGNQWYKNRPGVVHMYNAWRKISKLSLPLLMVGEPPSPELLNTSSNTAYKDDILFLTAINDDLINDAYSGATAFLFPSLAEGFGWPIAEAMAAGTIVITTGEMPMTEVAGNASFLIPGRPQSQGEIEAWAHNSARVVEDVVNLDPIRRDELVKAGLDNAARFDSSAALDAIESIYKRVLQTEKSE